MSDLTDAQKLASGNYVKCVCANVYPISNSSCPYCHRFNHASSATHCAVCGAAKNHWLAADQEEGE